MSAVLDYNDAVQAPAKPDLSPAFAAMMANIMMPVQYGRIMSDAVLSVNDKCPRRIVEIEK